MARWARCVEDLQHAVHDHAKAAREAEADGRSVEPQRIAEVGAWVVLLRIFPMALLRDFGGGGRAAEGRLRRQLEKWDSGDYLDAAFMPSRPRAVRRSRRAGAQSDEQLIRQIHKQVTDKGQQGLLSRARQALESVPRSAPVE